MIVYGRPSSVIACPRIDGSPLKCRCQKPMADEHDRLAPGTVFVCGKLRPSSGSTPERRQQRGRGVKPDHLLRVAASGQRERIADGQREVAEHLLPLLHLEKARIRKADAHEVLRVVRRAQPDQPIGLAIGQRPQEHRVDHAEQRDVRADAEREAERRRRT